MKKSFITSGPDLEHQTQLCLLPFTFLCFIIIINYDVDTSENLDFKISELFLRMSSNFSISSSSNLSFYNDIYLFFILIQMYMYITEVLY